MPNASLTNACVLARSLPKCISWISQVPQTRANKIWGILGFHPENAFCATRSRELTLPLLCGMKTLYEMYTKRIPHISHAFIVY